MNNRHTARNSFFARCAQALAAKRQQAAKAAPALAPIVEPLEQRYAPAVVVTGALSASHNETDGQINPGDVIHYSETITNTGDADALNLQLQHLLDSNTSLIAGSVNVSPLAFDDFFVGIGNTPLVVGNGSVAGPSAHLTGSLFANDREFLGDTFTLSGFSATSAHGGTVSVNPDGTFTYIPSVGFTGVDTFTYTITDDGADGSAPLTSTGTVSVTINNLVWYVDDTASAGGTGDASHPFNSFSPLNGPSDVDNAGDHIFVFKGSGHTAGGITLEDNQKLIGQGVDLTVSGYTLFTGSTTDRPTLEGGAATITLGSGNTVSGVNVNNAAGRGIFGSNVGNLKISNVAVNVTGGSALNLANGTADVTLDSISSTNSTGTGLNLQGIDGSFHVSGATTISGAAGIGVKIVDSNADLSFGDVSVGQRHNTGIFIDNAHGSSISFGNVTVPNPNAAGGYGIRIEDSSAAITMARADVSGAHITIAQEDQNLDSVPENEGDGDNIFLARNTGSFTLHGGVISDAGNDGIDIRSSSNVVLHNVTVTRVGVEMSGTSSAGTGGHGIYATDLTGNNWFDNVTISHADVAGRDGVRVVNSIATPMTLTLDHSTVRDIAGGEGIRFTGNGSAHMGLFVQNSSEFMNLKGTAITYTAAGSSQMDLGVKNSSFHDAVAGGLNTISASVIEGAQANVAIENNTFNNVARVAAADAGVINLVAAGTVASNQASFTIRGNTIQNIGNSTDTGYRGIQVAITNDAKISGNVVIENNTLQNLQREGIKMDFANSAAGSAVNARITGNTVGTSAAPVGQAGFAGILLQAGKANISTGGQVANVAIATNSVVSKNTTSDATGATIFARATGDSSLGLTVTGNNLTNLGQHTEFRADANFAVSGGGSPTLSIDIAGNTLDSNAGSVEVRRSQGTVNIKQTNIAAANSIAPENVTVVGLPTYGAVTPAAPIASNDPTLPIAPTAPVTPVVPPTPPGGITLSPGGSTPPVDAWDFSGGNLNVTIGTLPVGKSITMNFATQVANSVSASAETIPLQGSISGDNFGTATTNTASTPVVAAPDLEIVSISDAHTNATTGDSLSYTINFKNAGNQDSADAVVTVNLPAGTSFDAANSDAGWVETSLGSGVYELHVGALGSAQTGSAVFAVTVDSTLAAGNHGLSVTASIAGTLNVGDVDPSANDSKLDTTVLDAAPELSVISTPSVIGPVVPGTGITYTLHFANSGNQDATGVVLTETLPAGTSFDAANSDAGWVETSPGVYQLTVGALAGAGGNGTVAFAVTVNDPVTVTQEDLTHHVAIADDGTNGAELVSSDNTAEDTHVITAAPDLEIISIDDSHTNAAAGDSLSYTIHYQNAGNQNAAGVYLTATLPAGTSFDSLNSDAGWVETSPGVYKLDVGALGSTGTGSAVFAVTVDSTMAAGIDDVAVTATIGGSFNAGDSDATPLNNSQSNTTIIDAAPSLSVVSTSSHDVTGAAPGEIITYTLDYTNSGDQGATGVVLTASVPAGTVFDAAHSDAGWTETAPGSGIYTYTVSGEVAGNGGHGSVPFAVVVSTASAAQEQIGSTVSITDDGLNSLAASTDSDSQTVTLVAAPDLEIVSISDAHTNATTGDSLSYTVNFKNAGNQDSADAVVTVNLPAGTSFDAANSDAGWVETSLGSGVYELHVGALGSAQTGSAVFAVTVDSTLAAGNHGLSVTASIAGTLNVGDVDPSANDSKLDTTVLDAAPELSVISTPSVIGPVVPGTGITYTLHFANSGNQDATGVVLTETLPAGTSFDAANSDAGWVETSPGVYQLTVGALAGAGGNGTVAFAVTVNDPVTVTQEDLTHHVAIADDGTNGAELVSSDNTAEDTHVITAAPDLEIISIDDSHTNAAAGDSLSYTIHYQNAGNQNAAGVYLTATLPAGTSFDSLNSDAGWVETSPGVYKLDVGALGSTGTGSAVFAVTVDSTMAAGIDDVAVTATIGGSFNAGDSDATPLNNSQSNTTIIDAAPSLSVVSTSSHDVTGAAPGEIITYTLDYTNSGDQGATGVVLTASVPAGTVFDAAHSDAGWTETAPGSGIYTYTVSGEVAGNGGHGSVPFAVVVSTASAAQEQIGSTVSITDDGLNSLAASTDSDSQTVTLVAAPDLEIVSISDAHTNATTGDSLSYTVNFKNAGNQDSADAVVTVNLPAGTSFDAANSDAGWVETSLGSGVYELHVGALGSAQTGSAVFAVTVDNTLAAGNHGLSVTASIAGTLNVGDVDPSANDSKLDTTVLDAAPELSVISTPSVIGPVVPGTGITYTLHFANSGNQDATGVVLTETLPAGTSFDAANSDAGWVETSPGVYQLTLGALSTGASGDVAFAVTVNGPAVASGDEEVTHHVAIADDGTNGAELVSSDNTAEDTHAITAAPDLEIISIDDSHTNAAAGDSLSYTIHYQNAGNQNAAGVYLTATLPAGTSFDSLNSDAGWVETSPGVYKLDVGALGSTGTGSAVFAVTVDSTMAAGIDDVAVTATIGGSFNAGDSDATPLNNSQSNTTIIDAAPSLSVVSTSSHDVTGAAPGEIITYTLDYTNSGDQGATGVVLTASVPAGTVFDAAHSDAGWTETAPGSGIYTYTVSGEVAGNGGHGSVPFAVVVSTASAAQEQIGSTVSITDDGLNSLAASTDSDSQTVTLVAAPDLEIVSISDAHTNATTGDSLSYTVNFKNAGNQDSADAVVTVNLPAGTSFDAANSDAGWVETSLGSGVYELHVGALGSAQTGSAVFAVTVDNTLAAGNHGLSVTASIAGTLNVGDVDPSANDSKLDTTVLDAAPELSVISTPSVIGPVVPGAGITYTLHFANSGNQDATGVVLTETLPAGTSFDAANSDAGWVETSPGVYQLTVGALAGAGGNGTVAFAVTVNNTLAAGQEQVAHAVSIHDDNANGADPNPLNNSASDTNAITATPDLQLSISNGVSVVSPSTGVNDVVVWDINYHNVGNQAASGVVITQNVPAGATFDAAHSTNGWTQVSPGVYQLALSSDVAAGAQGHVNFAVKITNAAVSGQTSISTNASITNNNGDTDLTNNSASDTDILDAEPELQITATNNSTGIVIPGEVVVWKLDYKNVGDQDANGIVITEHLPAGTVFHASQSSPGWTETAPGSGVYTLSIPGTLAGNGGTGAVYFAARVVEPAAAGQEQVVNDVQIRDNGANGLAPATGSVTDVDQLKATPDLKIISFSDGNTQVTTGSSFAYQIRYQNGGNQDAAGVYLQAVLPTGASFDAAHSAAGWAETSPGSGVYRLNIGALNGTSTGEAIFAVTANDAVAAGIHNLPVTVTINGNYNSGDADPLPADNSATDTNILNAAPNLGVVSTSDHSVTGVQPGEVISYTINYSNSGTQGATGVVITETLPAGTSFDATLNPGWTRVGNTNQYTYNVGAVGVGATGAVTFKATVVSPALAGQETIGSSVSIIDDLANGADLNLANNSDTHSDTLIATPDLKITGLTDGKTSATPGDVLTYSISYANIGNQGATGTYLTANLPAGATFDAANSAAGWTEVSAGVYRLNVGTLAGTGTGQVNFAMKVNSPAAAGLETLPLNVSISDDGSNGADTNPANNQLSDTNSVNAAPDLKLVSTSDRLGTVGAGDTITYTVAYSNNGNQNATGVVISETLPAGATFNPVLNPGWTQVGNTNQYTYNVGALAAGGSGAVTFKAVVDNPAVAGQETLSNNASIADDGLNGPDSNLANNLTTETHTLVAAPDLKITSLSDGRTSTVPGDVLTYTINYSNVGTQGARGVMITETLPAGTTFDAAQNPGWTQVGNTNQYTYNVGDLAGGSAGNVAFKVTVQGQAVAGQDTVSNTVSIADNGANGADLNAANNSAIDINTLVAAPDLKITSIGDGKTSAAPGEVLTYAISYGNDGNQASTGAYLVATVPAGASYNAGASTAGWVSQGNGVYRLALSELTTGASGVANFAVTVNSPAVAGQENIAFSASIADNGANGADTDASNNSGIDSNILVAAPDLQLTSLSDGKTNAAPGDVLTYTLNYANGGNQGATGTYLTATLPVGTSFDATNSTAGWTEISSGVYRLNVGALAGAATGAANFAVKVSGPAAAGLESLTLNASIADDGFNGVDTNLTNNSRIDTNTLVAAPDLTIQSTSDKSGSVNAGDLLTYTLAYSNAGNQNAKGVVITETLPAGTTFSPVLNPGWTQVGNTNQYTYNVGDVNGGVTGSVAFKVTVANPAAAGQATVSNSVAIVDDGANGLDLNPANNSAIESHTLVAAPDLKITGLSDGKTSAAPGDVLTYAINYANAGTQGATGAYLTATLPAGTSFNAAASTAGWVDQGGGVYKLALNGINGGATGAANFAVTVSSPAAAGLESLPVTVAIADDASNGADLNSSNNSLTDTNSLVAAPDLKITSFSNGQTSVNAGDVLTYTVNYANGGNQAATGVVISETLPAGTTFDAAQNPGWTQVGNTNQYTYSVGSLAGGATGTVAFKVTVANPAAAGLESLSSSASIVDDASNGVDPTPANNSAIDTDTLVAAPDLKITGLSDGKTSAAPGDVLTYAINYANAGTQGATGAYLTATLPAGTSFNAAASTAGWVDQGGGVYKLALNGLNGGATGAANFAVKVSGPAAAGLESLTLNASIADDGFNGVDTNLTNNSLSDTNTLVAAPDLTIQSTSDKSGSVNAGDLLTYTLAYSNAGNQNAKGVVITETLPAGTTFSPVLNPGWTQVGNTNQYTYNVGDVNGGVTGSVAFKVTVANPAAAGQATVSNSVAIVDDGANGLDLNPANNSAIESHTLVAAPDLKITGLSDGKTSAAPGDVLTYAINYANAGTQGATGAYLTATLPAGTSFNAAASTAGWVDQGGGVYKLALNGINGGATGAANFAVTVSSPAAAGLESLPVTVAIADDASNGADLNSSNNSLTDTNSLVAAPDLKITSFSNGQTSVNAGDVLTYTVNYANGGNQAATGVVISETLPAGTTFDAAQNPGWTQVGNTNQYTYSVGSLAGGATGTVAFKVTVANPAAAGLESLSSSASIVDDASNGVDPTPANNSAIDTDTLVAAPDLKITGLSDGKTSAAPGDVLTYAINYANAGTQGATGAYLTATLPAGTSFNAAASTAGWVDQGGGVYKLALNGLNGGATGAANFAVKVSGPAAAGLESLTLNASIADDASNGADLNPANNSLSDTNTLVAAPDLSIHSTSDKSGSVNAGDLLTYTLAYSNAGNQNAKGVVITETLPTGTTFNAALNPGWTQVGNTNQYTYTLGDVNGGVSGTVAFKVSVTNPAAVAQESLSNTVAIVDDGANGADTNLTNNTSTESHVLVASHDLKVVTVTDGRTSTAPGDVLSYTINYSNAGNQNATGVKVVETLPAGTTFNAALNPGWTQVGNTNQYVYTIGNLNGGASGAVAFKVSVAGPAAAGLDTVSNTVVISDDGANGAELNVGNNSATDTYNLVAAPDLKVTSLSDGKSTAVPGDVLTYTVNYGNGGNQAATGVVLTQTLPDGTSLDLAQNPGWSLVSGNTYAYNVGELAGGANGTVALKLTVVSPAAAGLEQITTSVSIADNGANGADLDQSNNSRTDIDTLAAAPDLKITSLSNGKSTVAAGETLTYTINYANAGNQGSTGAYLTATLPAGTTFDAAQNPGWNLVGGNVYAYNVGNLASGGNGSVAFKATVVNPAAAGLEQLSLTASITDDKANGADQNAADNTATDIDTLNAAPDLAITGLSDGKVNVSPGDVLTYTVDYANSGTQGSTGAYLVATVPAGTTFDAAHSAAGWTQTGPGTYRLNIGAVAGATNGQVAFAVAVTSPAAAGLENLPLSVSIADDGANGADLNSANNVVVDTDTLVAAPDLKVLSASDKQGTVNPGDSITYTFAYSNAGNQNAKGVVLTETIPAGTTVDLSDPANAGWSRVDAHTYTYNVGDLAGSVAGAATFKVKVASTTEAGIEQLANSVTIADNGANGADLNASDNTAGTALTLNSAVDLHLSQTDANITATRGGIVSYTLTYANTGNQHASGVYLTQHVPAGSTFDAGTSAAGWELQPDGSYRLAVGDVTAGAAPQSVVFAVKVDGTVPAGTHTLESMASISDDGTSGTDANVADNAATASTGLYQGILAVGRGKGGTSTVRVFNADNPSVEVRSFLAYEKSYKGGISVAVADVNGDGFDDIITATQSGTGRIRVFDGVTGERLLGGIELAPFGKSGRGANLAAGDVNGDGKADIIVGQAYGNQVKVYDGATGALSSTFKAFPTAGGVGVQVATADLNGDGKSDIIAAQKNRVKVFDGATNTLMHDIVPAGSKGNVSIAVGDVTGDGRADLILGSQTATSVAKVSTYTIDTNGVASLLETTTPFGSKVLGAVRVAAVDVNVDGIADIIIAGRSSARVETVKAIDGETGTEIASFNSFGDTKTVPGVVAGTGTLPKIVVG